jgi:3-oxoacyl-[acyl-carrier-protein] synthase III
MNCNRNESQGLLNVRVLGTGSYAPERILTNKDLEKIVDTTDEWIVTRTGMRERRIAAEGEATSDIGAAAARRAMASAGVEAEEIDLLIVPTITPDIPWPNTACLIQNKIGAVNAACIGLEAACTGFIYALETARNYLATGAARTALVVGAEKMSSILDWEDRNTCVLFGDGAGAVVLRGGGDEQGLIASAMGSDGSLCDLLMVPAGGSRLPTSAQTVADRMHFLKMNGREVYKYAVGNMTQSALDLLAKCAIDKQEIDWLIPHQANMRIIQAVSRRLDIPLEKFIVNIEKYGNTSGASIGLALDEAVADGRIKRGDKILCVAFGGGFTWGATLMVWTK